MRQIHHSRLQNNFTRERVAEIPVIFEDTEKSNNLNIGVTVMIFFLGHHQRNNKKEIHEPTNSTKLQKAKLHYIYLHI